MDCWPAMGLLGMHFGKTHGTREPFAVAMRRQLSALHPVIVITGLYEVPVSSARLPQLFRFLQ